MAKLLILFISLAIFAGSIEGRFPSKYRVLYPRSIPEGAKGPEPSSKEIDSLDSKELIPKNLLNTPKDLKGEEPYGQEGRQKGYPKGGPESLDGPYGPQGEGPEGGYPRGGPEGPSRREYPKRRRGPGGYPGGPEGPEGPEGPGGYGPQGPEGLGFGPDGPCMSKRCNPFRSRKPSYRAYLQRLMSRKMGNDGPGYGPPPPPMHLPMIEEVIIVRRIPVILSKLLIAVALDPSKFKKEEGGKPGDGKEPVGPPAPEYGNEEEVLPKDQPYGDKKKEGYADLTKSKQGPKDKEFDESMGEEELVAKKYSSQGEKDEKEEKKLEPYSNKDKEIKLKYDEKEYLEKPGKYGEGNDLEPRSSELKKEKESNANKIEP